MGLLQIRIGDVFGSVCRILNEGAATVACRSMGYSQGSAGSVDCAGYGGESLCGSNGSPVAVQDLSCIGDELSLNECTWSKPESDCSSHAQDAVVFCSSGQVLPPDGSLRLLAADGAPASTGHQHFSCKAQIALTIPQNCYFRCYIKVNSPMCLKAAYSQLRVALRDALTPCTIKLSTAISASQLCTKCFLRLYCKFVV